MIAIREVKKESRLRDRKRKRLFLIIGNKKWHITREEAEDLRRDLNRIILPKRVVIRACDAEIPTEWEE